MLSRKFLLLVLVLAGTTLFSGCLVTRACGGTVLSVNGRALDGESGAGMAGAQAYVSLGYGKRKLIDNESCGISGEDGVIHFEGPFRWTQVYGPVGSLKRRLTRNRHCTPDMTVELHQPGFESEIRTYSDDAVFGTLENPYRVELGDVTFTRVKTEEGPKS